MKKRWLLILLSFALVVTAVWFLPQWTRKSANDVPTGTSDGSHQTGVSSDLRPDESEPDIAMPNTPASAASATVAEKENAEKRQTTFLKLIEEQNTPVRFHGKVIDQSEAPIAGAQVKVKVRHWRANPIMPSNAQGEMIALETETVADGTFYLQGATGDGVDIVDLSKDGYELSPKTYRHSGPSNGTPESPAVFKMWKKGIPAELVIYDKDTRIPYDGSPVIFDLVKGSKVTGEVPAGDLRIALRRDPLQRALGSKDKYDWHASIEAVGGGLVVSDDEFMYLAPENGYTPSLQIEMLRTYQNWSPNKKISFYLKSRGGQCYGRVTVDFRTDSNRETTGFSIYSAVNATGSRNLQP